MATRTLRIASIAAIIIAAIVLAGVAYARRDETNSKVLSNKIEQQAKDDGTTNEQIKENDGGDMPVVPDVNSVEFKLTASSVSCSTTNINGVESRSCSGNIRVIPRAQADMDPGLYKINEQTKLMHDGVEQDLNYLQQLAQANSFVRITLAPGSSDTLSLITY